MENQKDTTIEKECYEAPTAVFMPVNLEERLLECDHSGGCWHGN